MTSSIPRAMASLQAALAKGPSQPGTSLAVALQFPEGLSPSLLSAEQGAAVLAQVRGLPLADLAMTDIARLGAEAETGLHQSLGSFLDRIDRSEAPQIFRL